jgi:hypothetical protein
MAAVMMTNHKKWINNWMYSAERSALTHAKQGQNYLIHTGAQPIRCIAL